MVTDPQVIDPTAQSDVSTPAPNPADPASGKSPLEILEEILQQQPPAAAPMPPAEAAPAAPVDSTPPALTPEEIAAMEAKQEAEDQVALAAKQAEMASITQTQEYQNRVAQDQASADQKAQDTQAKDGFEIKQLDHTKIAE